ncbi:hypothetical protein ABTY59_33850 [Streptomyces sp. NPDC096079]|uniref:hypothetical protein n=1 Tax=Streptomyces sp. NPDC096079 TaxID=3155820 RepID=UPI00333155AF
MDRNAYPPDLIRTQTAWTDAYAELASVGTGSTTVLRRRLLRLSVRLWWHPFWATAAGGPAARVALRELVHAGRGDGVSGA